MSLKKEYLKSKPLCRVTFVLPAKLTENTSQANLVGEFNDWNKQTTPMKRIKGIFSVTIMLEKGREYLFRYLLDEDRWENDPAADKYLPSPMGNNQNSVVVV